MCVMPDLLTTTTYWLPPTAVQYDRTGRKAHAKVLRDDYAEGTGLYPMQGFTMASDQVCCVGSRPHCRYCYRYRYRYRYHYFAMIPHISTAAIIFVAIMCMSFPLPLSFSLSSDGLAVLTSDNRLPTNNQGIPSGTVAGNRELPLDVAGVFWTPDATGAGTTGKTTTTGASDDAASGGNGVGGGGGVGVGVVSFLNDTAFESYWVPAIDEVTGTDRYYGMGGVESGAGAAMRGAAAITALVMNGTQVHK